MLLSKMPINQLNIKILNDKDFDTLGLIATEAKFRLLTFLDDMKYIDETKKDTVAMILTTSEIAKKISPSKGIAVCENPRNTFFTLHNLLRTDERYIRKDFRTIIGENCNISVLAYIDPSNVIIGNHVIIEEFASIKANTVIGDYSIIRAGSVLGSSGFEFKRNHDEIISVEHCGGVILGANVEIKCNTVVDKAIYPWDNTYIGNYSKLDNLIHIGHACKIMERVMIPANSVIGGRVKIESDSWIGIGSAVRNGIHIGKRSRVNMGAVVTKDVPDEGAVSGNFAISHEKFLENLKSQR